MPQRIETRCCISGGGPAGMMLGLLLARCGIDIVVLEKHGDFLRDFRGDTVHPSTLEIMHELGLLQAFLQRPHDKAYQLSVAIAGQQWLVADFSHLRQRCNYIAMMPQWDFLDFLHDQARSYPNFHLLRNAEVTDLIQDNDRVKGVRAQTSDGPLLVHADLVIGADGRHSAVRKAGGMAVCDLGAPIDVLWMRMPTAAEDPVTTGGRLGNNRFFIMIHRGHYWQCAYVIPKGGFEALRTQGLAKFHAALAEVAPMLADRVDTLQSWDDIKLLSVTVDRLKQWWQPGLLCIGDAAHAMSPIGGVGINLAIQDAVASANILSPILQRAVVDQQQLTVLLRQVQQRRLFPVRVIQAAQLAIQNRVLLPTLQRRNPRLDAPWPIRLLKHFPLLQRIPAYVIGIGVRAEHVAPTIRGRAGH